MILSEMVRKMGDEQILVNDTSNYDSGGGVHDWQDRTSKQMTLDKEYLVYITATGAAITDGFGAWRVLLGTQPILASGGHRYSDGAITKSCFLRLAAGTYTFYIQSARWYTGGAGYQQISKIYIATINFADETYSEYDTDWQTVGNGLTVQLCNFNVTIPGTRNLPIGSIKNYVIQLIAHPVTDAHRLNALHNPGESLAGSYIYFKLYIDGVQVSWDDRDGDTSTDWSNLDYGEGAYGKYTKGDCGVNKTVAVRVDAYNHHGSDVSSRVVLKIVVTPWLMPKNEYQPITLSFPQLSTLYIVLEPAEANPTKTIKIGRTRFVSFGDSTDYYSSSSGTNILSLSYTFESVSVADSWLMIGGFGGCVSIIAVDMR